jgi:HAD superfamily hydrolase (TIGR01450 family)
VTEFPRLAAGFRCLLFDAYGVLKAHAGLFPGAVERLRHLTQPWWIVSNDASRTPQHLAAGYPAFVDSERFVSSGMVLRQHLESHPRDGVLAYLGPPTCAGTFEGLGVEAIPFMELDDLERVSRVALMDEACFDWQRELNRLVNLVRRRPQVEVLAPNPDRLFPSQPGQVGLGSGALVALLEAATGRDIPHFGKPCPAIYELALARARALLPDLQSAEVLMIGDTLATDVAGAQAMGFKSLLVLSGNETAESWEQEAQRLGLQPDYVLPALA